MKDIHIIELELKNFAGVAQGLYKFEPFANEIKSAVGTGKSSCYFAYLWALGFNVNGWEPKIEGVYRIHNLTSEVVIKLGVDNLTYTIKRINTPKYKIDKFTGEENYTGSTSQFFIDDEKFATQEAFRKSLENIFGIDYKTIELLSSIELFNTQSNTWDSTTRRKFLFNLFNINEKTKDLANNAEFEILQEYLLKGKDENDIKQALNTERTTIDKELAKNNVLIEEKSKMLAEYFGLNFDVLENKKAELQQKIDEQRANSASHINNLIADKYEKLNQLKTEYIKAQNAQKDIELEKTRKKSALESEYRNVLQDIDYANKELGDIEQKRKELQIKETDIQNETLDDSKTICPTCHQPLKEDDILKIVGDFNKSKQDRLQDIALNMSNLAVNAQHAQTRLNTLATTKSALESQLDALNEGVDNSGTFETDNIKKEIDGLEEEIKLISGTNKCVDTQKELDKLQEEYDTIVAQLAQKENMNRITEQINNLKSQNRELAVRDSTRIQKANALKKYIEEKIKLVNTEINNAFEKVSYVFFEFNSANAQSEYRAICECMFEGVTYNSMSTGQKVLANYYTGKALRKILQLNIPQFVDDVAISDIKDTNTEWQEIRLITDNNLNVPVTLIKKIYSIADCDRK